MRVSPTTGGSGPPLPAHDNLISPDPLGHHPVAQTLSLTEPIGLHGHGLLSPSPVDIVGPPLGRNSGPDLIERAFEGGGTSKEDQLLGNGRHVFHLCKEKADSTPTPAYHFPITTLFSSIVLQCGMQPLHEW